MGHVTWGIIVASGRDEQLTTEADTAFLSMGSKPVLTFSLLAYEKCSEIDGVVVVVRKERMETVVNMVHMFGFTKVKKVVAGASNRRTSVQNGVKALDDDVTVVSIHEASRPCVSEELIAETIRAAKRYGCGVAAAKITESIKEVDKGHKVSATLDHSKLWAVQTPQTFKRELLDKALQAASKKKSSSEDESTALDYIRKPVHLVPSTRANLRILDREDLALASALLNHN